jgi:hypothetical protein
MKDIITYYGTLCDFPINKSPRKGFAVNSPRKGRKISQLLPALRIRIGFNADTHPAF